MAIDAIQKKRFADEEVAGSVIRGGAGLCCAVMLLGTPSLIYAIGNVTVLLCVVGCMGVPPLALYYGLQSESPHHPLLNCVSQWACLCSCGLLAMLVILLMVQLIGVPATTAALETCCTECEEYCAMRWNGVNHCPQEDSPASNYSTSCATLPRLEHTICSISHGFMLGDDEVVPHCAEDAAGCVFPVWCHEVATRCYATDEENAALVSPKPLRGRQGDMTKLDAFSGGPCYQWQAWRDVDWSVEFGVLYVIGFGGLLGCLAAFWDVRWLSRLDYCVLVPVPPTPEFDSISPQYVPSVGTGSSSAVIGHPVVLGRVVAAHPAGSGGSGSGGASDAKEEEIPADAQAARPAAAAGGSEDRSLPVNHFASSCSVGPIVRPPSTLTGYVRSNQCQTVLLMACCFNVCLIIVVAAVVLPAMFGAF